VRRLPETSDYAQLLRAHTHYIDVRAEAEFDQGSLQGAINAPILNNDERRRVGICYKSNGPAAATALGHKIVSGDVRTARLRDWLRIAETHPNDSVIMCWRGGQRSHIAQQWLAEAGSYLPLITNGFKALRQFCLAQLDAFATADTPWLLIGGRTGAGKTAILERVHGAIDLEGHANHRGSAFGGYPEGQPTPINFENTLAQTSLRHSAPLVVLEDEGSTIGRLGLPREWHARMQQTPLAQLEVDQSARVENIFAEYVGTNTTSPALAGQYLDALQRIRRRLGGARSDELKKMVADAFTTGSEDTHRGWIKALLDYYYDPMYDYQLTNKADRIKVRGSAEEIIAYVRKPQ